MEDREIEADSREDGYFVGIPAFLTDSARNGTPSADIKVMLEVADNGVLELGRADCRKCRRNS